MFPMASGYFAVYFKTPTYYHHGSDRLLRQRKFWCSCHGTGHGNPWSGTGRRRALVYGNPICPGVQGVFGQPAETSTIRMQVTLSWIQWKPWEPQLPPKRPSKGCR